MTTIPLTPEIAAIARRIIWFEPPERALKNTRRFMAYAMTYARHEDMRVIRRYVTDDDFRDALDHAPPGIIDPRSWAYWNSKMGRYPPPPLPRRRFDATRTGQQGGAQTDLEEVRRRAREAWLAKYGSGRDR